MLWLLTAPAVVAFGQVPPVGNPSPQNQGDLGPQLPDYRTLELADVALRPDYVLGADDQVLVRVPQETQIHERSFVIDEEGKITLPLVGSIQATGLTVQALEARIADALRQYVRDPLVTVTVVEYRSEPIFLMGAFRNPGIYPLQGRRTLVEMLAAAGGLLPNASRRIQITRRAEYGPLALPGAIEDAEQKVSTVEISLESLTQSIHPEEQLLLRAYDIVSVEFAESVYVSGEVERVGAISLGGRGTISIAQALTEAGGFTPTAKRSRVLVLRPVVGTNRRAAFEIDARRVLEGKEHDMPLLPRDVVHVPRASTRAKLSTVGATLVGSIPFILTDRKSVV